MCCLSPSRAQLLSKKLFNPIIKTMTASTLLDYQDTAFTFDYQLLQIQEEKIKIPKMVRLEGLMTLITY